jgi:hypothetical protein
MYLNNLLNSYFARVVRSLSLVALEMGECDVEHPVKQDFHHFLCTLAKTICSLPIIQYMHQWYAANHQGRRANHNGVQETVDFNLGHRHLPLSAGWLLSRQAP